MIIRVGVISYCISDTHRAASIDIAEFRCTAPSITDRRQFAMRICSVETCPVQNHGDTITCFTCHLQSHIKCYDITKTSTKSIGGACNIQFVCDTCVASYKPIGSQVSSIMEGVDRKVTAVFNSVAKMSKSIDASIKQQADFVHSQQQTLKEENLKIATEITQQQLAQSQTNELLNGIHTTLKENALTAATKDVSLGDEIRNVLVEMKTSLGTMATAKRTRRNTTNSAGSPSPSPNANVLINGRVYNRTVGEINDLTITQTSPTDLDSKPIVVSNLHPSISSDHLVQYVKRKLGPSAEQCTIPARALIPKNKSVVDLNVPSLLYQAIMDPGIWPQGAAVRDFEHRPRKQRPSGVFLSM